MSKVIFIIAGILAGLFGLAQILQLSGLIGTKHFSIAGVAFSILGLALAVICFQKAFKATHDQ